MIAQLDWNYLRHRPWKVIPRLVSHFLFQGRYATTSHRWLNPFILAGLRFLSIWPHRRDVEDPIFILGTGRSGSTILARLLSLHPTVGFLNEPKALWYIVDNRDDIHNHFGTETASYHITPSPHHRKKVHRLYRSFLNLGLSGRILDKNPDLTFRVHLLRDIFPKARFIFLVRDSKQTITSIQSWSESNRVSGQKTEDWWGVDGQKWGQILTEIVPNEPLLAPHLTLLHNNLEEPSKAAVEWIVTVQEGVRLLNTLPDECVCIRYEQLLNNPRETLIKIGEFCNLSYDKKMLAYADEILTPPAQRSSTQLPLFLETAISETEKAIAKYQE